MTGLGTITAGDVSAGSALKLHFCTSLKHFSHSLICGSPIREALHDQGPIAVCGSAGPARVRWLASVLQGRTARGIIPGHHSCGCYARTQSSLYHPLTLCQFLIWSCGTENTNTSSFCAWYHHIPPAFLTTNELSFWNSWCLWWLLYYCSQRQHQTTFA